ncbi:hypothetical protein DUI87_01587 [Hirundo rustica rustica]|uniref:Uncharacterized protein n=1 Tax=Hirundo rustica rustica TaxID=333673 RepID=A0A3M0L5R2_HIRRU|nr:hypothetical protein DUI87_01587 [Hirundo rustica rustica]
MEQKQWIALGILVQNLGPYRRAVAYLSKQLDTAAKGWPGCLRAVAAVNIQEARKLTLGQKMTVLVSHTCLQSLGQKGDIGSPPTEVSEQDDVEIVVTNTVNPASFLGGSKGEPVIHDILETIEATYSSRPDLKDTLLKDAETWFTDGSSYVVSGRRRAGYAVTTSKEVIESGPLPTNTSARKAEIIALIRALELAKGKEINIYTDSTYAFGVIHAHGAIWKERGLLNSQGRSIKHAQEILRLLDAVQLPERLAIMHIKAHQKVSSELEEGNMLADREAKEAAKGEVPDKAVEAALIPDGKVSIEADLRQLFSCLLDSTEFKLWEAAWRQLLREALPSLLTDPETAMDENGNALTLEHLMDPPPTLQDMLRVCQLKVPYMQGNDCDAKSTTPRVAAISGTQQEHIRRPLELTKALHLKSMDWTFLSVNLKEQSTWPVQGKELVVIGDSAGQAIIHHYMDDVLVCAPTDDVLTHALDLTINALIAAGFELQEEKVQRMPPWKYLGLEIGKRTIVPQKLAIKTKWKDIPKKDQDGKDPLSIIEWVFLSHQRSKRMTRPQELVAELIRKARSHKSVLTWKDPQTQQWEADVAEVEGSPQVAELAAVVRAFERFPEPFNLVTDSAYVAGVVSRAEQAILQEVSNIALYELLSKLVKLFSHQEQPFFVMHTRSHTELPGFIVEGNRKADALAAPAEMAPLPNIFEQAKLSHQLFHQNAPGLVRRFHLTQEQAKAIVAAFPSCSQHAVPTLYAGVNPRGLRSCEVWQTDVTHFPEFGRQKYIHVSIDTFSGAVFASAHTGEKAGDTIKHLIHAFSFLGIPKELKTDNGPAYKSRELCSFLQQWGVEHKTGIPHSPTGQAMVERTHGTIKKVLHQQQRVLKAETPAVRLARALFTINFLNCSFEGLNPPIIRHFGASSLFSIRERPPVMVRDPESGRTEGPHDLVTWGRGYACVSTPTGPRWIPSKWVKPYVPKVSGSKTVISPQVADAAWRRKRKQGQHPWAEFPFPYCSYPE